MNKLSKGIKIIALTMVMSLGLIGCKEEKLPIQQVKEAYEEYGYIYALKIIEGYDVKDMDLEEAEEWLDAINYLGEQEFGYLWNSIELE